MPVATTDLWRMSATELAHAIRSRQTSSQEVIESHLRRIEAVNPSINAVTVVLGEQAIEAAKAADRAVARGGELPAAARRPFHCQREHRLSRYANHRGAQGASGRVSGFGRSRR